MYMYVRYVYMYLYICTCMYTCTMYMHETIKESELPKHERGLDVITLRCVGASGVKHSVASICQSVILLMY